MVLILNVYVSNVTEKEFNQEFDKLLDVLGSNLFFSSLFKFRKTWRRKIHKNGIYSNSEHYIIYVIELTKTS